MDAIILAGGLGTRLRKAVADTPKPMALVNGRPFLEHQLDYWIAEGVCRFVLSVGYKSKVIENHFGAKYRDCEIDYAIEKEPMGTGGGLLLAAERMSKSPFLLLNGDTFFEVPLNAFFNFHKEKEADITIALLDISKNDRYGCVEMDKECRIRNFEAEAKNMSYNLINGGAYLITRQSLDSLDKKPGQKANLEKEILPGMIRADKRIYGYPCEGVKFIDIGVPKDYEAAAKLLG